MAVLHFFLVNSTLIYIQFSLSLAIKIYKENKHEFNLRGGGDIQLEGGGLFNKWFKMFEKNKDA